MKKEYIRPICETHDVECAQMIAASLTFALPEEQNEAEIFFEDIGEGDASAAAGKWRTEGLW